MRWADGCTSGRNASSGEPAAYQARWHRFGVGLDSVRPPELASCTRLARVQSLAPCKRIPVKDRRLG